jgi:probable rRNA maturation factor
MIGINNTTKYKIDANLVKKVAGKFLASRHWQKKDLSLAFIGEATMRELNKRYRRKDYPTDVLSFGNPLPFQGGDRGGSDLGEIIINPAQIKKQARDNGNTFKQELIFILVHGLLHLAGYDDRTEKARLRMIKMGEKFIKNI